MKEQIKEALLEMIVSGDIELELPDSTINDGIRRNKSLVRELIDYTMRNGGFPKDRVQGMMDEKLVDYRAELRKHMETLVDEKKFAKMFVLKEGKKIETGIQHKQFEHLLAVLQCGLNAYLVGPAGSGKTTAAEMCAKALEVPFYFTGAITSEFKLTGFIDANGRVICPAFRKAYENGGLFLFDEIDASMPQAVLAFNAAIANGMMDFPDKTVPKHKDFYCVAAANTYGFGADRVYVGRNQLDGATVDRFVMIDWDYDEDLEHALSRDEEWTDYVQMVRRSVVKHKIRHVVSPRASIFGAKLLLNKVERKIVEASVLWKGLDKDSVEKILKDLK